MQNKVSLGFRVGKFRDDSFLCVIYRFSLGNLIILSLGFRIGKFCDSGLP